MALDKTTVDQLAANLNQRASDALSANDFTALAATLNDAAQLDAVTAHQSSDDTQPEPTTKK